VVLIPILLPFLVHADYLSGEALLYTYDHAQLQYPRFRILCDTLQAEGSLPLWQTALYAGSPFHANPEIPTLYPPVVALAWFLSPIRVMNLTILLHTALGALGMYLLVLRLWRRLAADASGPGRGGEAGALVAALVFGFNFFTRMEHFNLPTYGAAHALIPWMVLTADWLLHGRGARRAAACLALLAGAQVATGGLYVYVYTALLLTVWFLVEGVCGDGERRRRTLVWGLAAGAVAVLLAAAKLVPYANWVETTNRVGAVSRNVAAGVTLGGHGDFGWGEVMANVGENLGSGWPLLLLLPALPLLRHRVVRLALGLGVLGFAIALGGLTHWFFYEWVPPFDRIRNASRAWTLANACLPIVMGLGFCHLLAVIGRRRPLPRPLFGIVVGVALLPALLDSRQHTEILERPLAFREVMTRYENWPEMAERAGDEWRVSSFDVRSPAARNEQFISTALGLEIVGGQLGWNWPRAMVRHLYSDKQGKLVPKVRKVRYGVLSVRYGTEGGEADPLAQAWKPGSGDVSPAGIDGKRIVTLRDARPRALLPGSVAGVFGDRNREVLYALLDTPGYTAERHTVLSLDPAGGLEEDELFDLDEIIVVEGDDVPALAIETWLPLLEQRGVRLTRVRRPLDPDSRVALSDVAARMAGRDGRAGRATFTRVSSGEVSVTRDASDEARWMTLSETWTLYGGWTAWAVRDDGIRRELPLHRADGVVTAFHLRAGETSVVARYEPADVRRGLWLGGFGLLLVLTLLVPWPERQDPEPKETE
jgi:hypothetical protein